VNFIKNLNTKTKLISLTFILLTSVFAYASWHKYIIYNQYIEMNKLEKVVILSTKISALVHETQKERGATAGYLGSKGAKFGDILKNQRVSTDIKLNNLNLYLKNFENIKYSKKFNMLLNDALSNIENLNSIRKDVDIFRIDEKKAIGFYTNKINAIFLNTIASVANMSTDAKTMSNINSYVNFLLAKERAGIERAVLSNTFGANKFKSGMYKKFIQLVTEQGSYINSFNITASKNWQVNLNSTLKGDAVNEVQRLRDIAFNKANIGGFDIDAVYWFNTITKKINLLKKIEDYQSDNLIKTAIEKSNTAWNTFIFLLIVFIILVVIAIGYTLFVIRHIDQSLKNIENGLISFFNFLNRKSDVSDNLNIQSKDEFGIMAKLINKNMDNTKSIINNDNHVVDEIIDLVEKAEGGFYSYSSKLKADSPELEKLRVNFNRMLDTTNNNLSFVKDALLSYGSNDFTHRITSRGICGNIGTLISSTQALGDNVSGLLSVIDSASKHLSENTNTLAKSTEVLSSSSNEQAASLEQTAASVEEIVSIIRANGTKAVQMYELSEETIKSAKDGEMLANSTTKAMSEIEASALEISNAITAIDQIAFQTNILSLNAAVEAATAGEMGKGFAVVAGEVRNLAARSVETAKEIKAIVDVALDKSSEGKRISALMIDGYEKLNKKVKQTSSLITEVSSSSKEQMTGIDQINVAIARLDTMTQKNAQTASLITNMTHKTSTMSVKLSQTVSNTKYLKEVDSQVCEVDLSFKVGKLKLDHIKFKDKYFTALGERKNVKVVTHHECAIGKWIDSQKGNKITTTTSWNKLLDTHESVHNGVQNYINNNNRNASNDTLTKDAASIENDTLKLFDLFNKVKSEHCDILHSK
jgi:methyl-accepting chemotaxis protein